MTPPTTKECVEIHQTPFPSQREGSGDETIVFMHFSDTFVFPSWRLLPYLPTCQVTSAWDLHKICLLIWDIFCLKTSKMYWSVWAFKLSKTRDLVIFGRDGNLFCLIFKQKAGWLVGMCLKYFSSSLTESSDRREQRNWTDRARCTSETAAQKEKQLRKRRLRKRAKRAAETEERAARLARQRANRGERLATETKKQRGSQTC